MGYNKCIIEGNLGKDSELRVLANGDAVLNFSVGANETWKDKDGSKKEHCEWVSCSLWGKRASALQNYLCKGKRVLVEGKLRTSTYDKNGETKYATKLIVSEVVLLSTTASKPATTEDGDLAPLSEEFGLGASTDEIPF